MKQLLPKKLEPIQQRVLQVIAESQLTKLFYLTGGTTLSSFYLHHRYSEDLDFFSETEFDPTIVTTFFKSQQSTIKYQTFDIQTSFNRFLVFLSLPGKKVLKTEFTYYPFPRIERKGCYQQLEIDSLIDIGTNKLFTIAQQPRSRDFIDLYYILKSATFTLPDLYRHAKIKFDWHIDPLQLLSRFTQIDESDFVMIYKPLTVATVRRYFEKQILGFSNQILKK
jgi:predicted nucleotidyltransferase component of viral defense system